jgi:hypothetical protein
MVIKPSKGRRSNFSPDRPERAETSLFSALGKRENAAGRHEQHFQ